MAFPLAVSLRGSRTPLVWAVPALVILFLFHYAAVVAGGWYAFTEWNGLGEPRFIGLANFADILTSEDARGALINTVKLAVVFVIGANLFGLLLALGLNRTLKSRFLLRSLFFAPVVMSPLAVSYIWAFIFDPRGPVIAALSMVTPNARRLVFLADPSLALWSIAAVMVWQFSGLCMSFYLAGLQGIPEELDEAAVVDGASPWRRFKKITFPLLAPAATVSISITTILGLRVFDQVMALTRGGPGYATETLATQIFKQTFALGRFGYGSAVALILTLLILAVSAIQIAVLRAREKRM